ncbi:Rib/alpha-like domain-containing protein [Actinotignum schaalii]|uniref:Rib/alpha-like domain-containing protein n=1 Tax=Actinotignum schaalii TaxID=59505 RepID=UPI002658FCAF|nr:Rib/alpha-like domain-containing protein [Actinotignum schaalii]MDE1559283.1 Rib/alpha-like domain-containing protein [Actinotignum schaalii]MDE1664273.1 Rib/alpha-like domain-containing protein [Actinotignum schaalii]
MGFVKCASRAVSGLRRLMIAILALMLIGGITIFTPGWNAMAAKVWWGPEGYVWYTSNHSDLHNTHKLVDVDHSSVNLPNGRKLVTYIAHFNREKSPAAFSGRAWLNVYLPKGLIDETIRITREKEVQKFVFGGMKWQWETVAHQQTIGDFDASDTRDAGLWPEPRFDEHWDKGFIQTDPLHGSSAGSSQVCQLTEWKNGGKFGRSLWSYEAGTNVYHRWMITAEVEQDFDVENEPVMVGYNSSNSVSSWENHFISYGPYDMDGDGMTDVQEKENGTDPYSGAVKYPTVKAEYGKVVAVKPYIPQGKLDYDNSGQGSWHFVEDSSKQSFRNFPAGTKFALPQSLPNSIQRVYTRDVKENQVFFNEDTGELLFSPSKTNRGQTVPFEVTVNYPLVDNCRPPQYNLTKLDIEVIVQANLYAPVYQKTEVQAGKTKTVAAPKDYERELPSGTRFEITAEGKRDYSWATMKSDGSIDLKPGFDVTPKDYSIPVDVTYPDGSMEKITAPVEVTKPDKFSDFYRPAYKPVTVKAGETGKVEPPKDPTRSLPQGTKFYKEPASTIPWAKVDKNTGEITLTPDRTTNPNDYSVPVKVVYPDNTTSVIVAPVKVLESGLVPGDFKLQVTRGLIPVSDIVLAEGQPLDPVVDISASQKLKVVDKIRFKTVCTKKRFDGIPETIYRGAINGWELRSPVNYWPKATEAQEADFARTGMKKPGIIYKQDGVDARSTTSFIDSPGGKHPMGPGIYECSFFASSNMSGFVSTAGGEECVKLFVCEHCL